MHDTSWARRYIILAAVECLYCCGMKVGFKAEDGSFEESMRAAKAMGAVLVTWMGVSREQVKNCSSEQSLVGYKG